MTNATRVKVSTFGVLAGLAGIEHVIGEVLQGNRAPEGTVILSWPGFRSWWAQLEDLNNPNYLHFSRGGAGRIDISRTGTRAGNETLVAANYTERFVRNHRDVPWFACFWPRAPHEPYYPLDRYTRTHRGDTPPTPYGEPGKDLSDKAPIVRRSAHFSEKARTRVRANTGVRSARSSR